MANYWATSSQKILVGEIFMSKIRKKWLLPVIVVIIVFVGKFGVLDNVNVLFSLAAGFDEPSTLYYLTTERIYRLSDKKNLGKKLLKYLEQGRNPHLHNLYIKTMAIIGEHNAAATTYLIKAYAKYQDNMEKRGVVFNIIDSMGFIGNKTAVSVLERLLSNYDAHRMVVPRYVIVRALYLSTGKAYDYIDDSGKETKLYLTDELKRARAVIVDSKGRSRTFEEMMVLDNINRPDEYKHVEVIGK